MWFCRLIYSNSYLPSSHQCWIVSIRLLLIAARVASPYADLRLPWHGRASPASFSSCRERPTIPMEGSLLTCMDFETIPWSDPLNLTSKTQHYLPLQAGMFVIFVSHQWLTTQLPDPTGYQMQALRRVLKGVNLSSKAFTVRGEISELIDFKAAERQVFNSLFTTVTHEFGIIWYFCQNKFTGIEFFWEFCWSVIRNALGLRAQWRWRLTSFRRPMHPNRPFLRIDLWMATSGWIGSPFLRWVLQNRCQQLNWQSYPHWIPIISSI